MQKYTKDRYEFIVEYRKTPDGNVLTRSTKFYTSSYDKAVALVKRNTKYLVSYKLKDFLPESLNTEIDKVEELECVVCTKPNLGFSKFCEEHYNIINGNEDILLIRNFK